MGVIRRLFNLIPRRGRAISDALWPTEIAADATGNLVPGVLPSETAAAPVGVEAPPFSSLAALLAGHVLRDGETVILLLRPSKWFIPLSSLRFLAVVILLTLVAMLNNERIPYSHRQYLDLSIFLCAGRLMWATLQWMGRLYVLTDLRIIRVSGVWNVDIFDCPLRKVARTILDITFRESLFRVGSVIIIPQDEEWPLGQWQMVPHPRKAHAQIVATINRAKHGAGWYR